MQIRIVAVDKVRERYISSACDDFRARLSAYFPLEIVEIKPSHGSQAAQCMAEESVRVLKAVQDEDCVWLLDRSGDQLSSLELSRMIDGIVHAGTRRMTFVIAGTYGAADELRERADFVWSLSQLTLLHEWARALVMEQLYRAAKIARDEPYHH